MLKLLIIPALFVFSQTSFALNCSSNMDTDSVEFLQCHFQCEEGVECKRFAKSMKRDSLKDCRPHPEVVEDMPTEFKSLEKDMEMIRGKVFYGGVVGGRYGYWMYSRKKHLVIHTTIHFENFDILTDDEKENLQGRFDVAAKIWAKHNPYGYPLKFAFQIVEEPERAHIKNVRLMKKTRGPYFDKWNINWSPHTIAHEFGHILGLDDEYSYFKKTVDGVCDKSSFMCKSNGGGTEIKNYHYYMVFRRLFCQA